MAKLDKQEKEWRAEDDARTIKRHAEIIGDEERYQMAKDYIIKEAEKAAAALKIADSYKQSGLI